MYGRLKLFGAPSRRMEPYDLVSLGEAPFKGSFTKLTVQLGPGFELQPGFVRIRIETDLGEWFEAHGHLNEPAGEYTFLTILPVLANLAFKSYLQTTKRIIESLLVPGLQLEFLLAERPTLPGFPCHLVLTTTV